jgi:hypothetical protein
MRDLWWTKLHWHRFAPRISNLPPVSINTEKSWHLTASLNNTLKETNRFTISKRYLRTYHSRVCALSAFLTVDTFSRNVPPRATSTPHLALAQRLRKTVTLRRHHFLIQSSERYSLTDLRKILKFCNSNLARTQNCNFQFVAQYLLLFTAATCFGYIIWQP